MTVPAIKVNRAPVLTLWAAVVAERLGHPPDLAATLGQSVAGSSARAKARSLGIADDKDREADKRDTELRPAFRPVRLLGKDIRLAATEAGELLAEDKGKPADPVAVRRYLLRAFGDRLGEVRSAMEGAAALFPPEELNRVGFRIHEGFRPEVPLGPRGGARRVVSCRWSGSARRRLPWRAGRGCSPWHSVFGRMVWLAVKSDIRLRPGLADSCTAGMPKQLGPWRRTVLSPRAGLFKGRGGLQHVEIVESFADDLQPHGQSAGREAGRYARGRVAGPVERVGELRPRQPIPRVLRPVLRLQPVGGEGGDAYGRS